MCGIRLSPKPVSSYSTRGGTSACATRNTNPSATNVRKVTDNIRCEMSPMALCNSLKRIFPLACSVTKTSIGHFSLKRLNTFRIGQLSDA